MKTRFYIIIFSVIAVFIAGLFVFQRNNKKETVELNQNRSKIVIPKTNQSENNVNEETEPSKSTESFNSFISLNPTETVISTISVDFNNDTYDDEVALIRRAGSEYVCIVPGVYNNETSSYDRLPEISTLITRANTMSVYAYDITGDHRISLIYQGIDDEDNSVMQIFIYTEDNQKPEFLLIGDFISDDTIFIQQVDRADSYELSSAHGESCSVWVYSSKPSATGDDDKKAMDQIQSEYKWNNGAQKYELAREIVIPANKLAARELSRIQDGSLETFAEFLNGLWYKTSNVDKKIRYFYFDYANKEIIQYYGNIQEIYVWGVSRVRHNGIYISSVNSSISNLHRRYDVNLISLDEIKIYTRDDVNLIINEDNLWDGNYKKVSLQSTFDEQKTEDVEGEIRAEIEKGPSWATADTLASITFEDNIYTLKTDKGTERGFYTTMTAGSRIAIQFRSDSQISSLSEVYVLEYGTKIEDVRGSEVTSFDKDIIVLTPAVLTPLDCYAVDGKVYTLYRTQGAKR